MVSQKRAKRKNKIKAPYSNTVLFFAVICVLFLAVQTHASQDPVKKEPKAEEAAKEDYRYDPTGKTDPFRSFIAIQEAMEAEKKKRKPRTYLETLDISQLDLIAIIVGPKGNYAMVRDAKGLGYVIKKGTPIGVREGVVYQINENEVIIREKVRGKERDVSKPLSSLE
jgi:type IV pilus assembly protein PilP